MTEQNNNIPHAVKPFKRFKKVMAWLLGIVAGLFLLLVLAGMLLESKIKGKIIRSLSCENRDEKTGISNNKGFRSF